MASITGVVRNPVVDEPQKASSKFNAQEFLESGGSKTATTPAEAGEIFGKTEIGKAIARGGGGASEDPNRTPTTTTTLGGGQSDPVIKPVVVKAPPKDTRSQQIAAIRARAREANVSPAVQATRERKRFADSENKRKKRQIAEQRSITREEFAQSEATIQVREVQAQQSLAPQSQIPLRLDQIIQPNQNLKQTRTDLSPRGDFTLQSPGTIFSIQKDSIKDKFGNQVPVVDTFTVKPDFSTRPSTPKEIGQLQDVRKSLTLDNSGTGTRSQLRAVFEEKKAKFNILTQKEVGITSSQRQDVKNFFSKGGKVGEIGGGIVLGFVPSTKGEVLTTAGTFALGGLVGGAVKGGSVVVSKIPKVGGVASRNLGRVVSGGGIVLGTGFVGATALQVSATPDFSQKGEIIGGGLREALTFGLGFKAGESAVGKIISARALPKITVVKTKPVSRTSLAKSFGKDVVVFDKSKPFGTIIELDTAPQLGLKTFQRNQRIAKAKETTLGNVQKQRGLSEINKILKENQPSDLTRLAIKRVRDKETGGRLRDLSLQKVLGGEREDVKQNIQNILNIRGALGEIRPLKQSDVSKLALKRVKEKGRLEELRELSLQKVLGGERADKLENIKNIKDVRNFLGEIRPLKQSEVSKLALKRVKSQSRIDVAKETFLGRLDKSMVLKEVRSEVSKEPRLLALQRFKKAEARKPKPIEFDVDISEFKSLKSDLASGSKFVTLDKDLKIQVRDRKPRVRKKPRGKPLFEKDSKPSFVFEDIRDVKTSSQSERVRSGGQQQVLLPPEQIQVSQDKVVTIQIPKSQSKVKVKPIVKQQQSSEQRFKEEPRQLSTFQTSQVALVPLLLPIQRDSQLPFSSSRQRMEQSQSTQQKQKLKQPLATSQTFAQAQTSAQTQVFKERQKIIITQIPKQIQSQKQKGRPRPFLIGGSKDQRPQGRFTVFLRRFGKFKPIGTSRTQRQAFEIGRTRASKTLGATFKVEGKGIKQPSKIPGFKTKKTKKGTLFIEEPKFRLSKRTETKEIQSFKRRRK